MTDGDAQPGAWGQAREMNGLEALMWRADAGARTASMLTKSAASESTQTVSPRFMVTISLS